MQMIIIKLRLNYWKLFISVLVHWKPINEMYIASPLWNTYIISHEITVPFFILLERCNRWSLEMNQEFNPIARTMSRTFHKWTPQSIMMGVIHQAISSPAFGFQKMPSLSPSKSKRDGKFRPCHQTYLSKQRVISQPLPHQPLRIHIMLISYPQKVITLNYISIMGHIDWWVLAT